MVADNIDNLENTMTDSRTSHDVHSILVTMKAPETNEEVEEGEEEYCPPTKRKCQRSLPPEAVSSEIPDYYVGKRVGLGQLNEVKNLLQSCSYLNVKDIQRLRYIVWMEVRKLKTHPTLLLPGWTEYNIKVAKKCSYYSKQYIFS